jgi:DNA-binding response OmpR family regulator
MDKTANILLIEDEVITALSLILDLKKHGYRNSKFVSSGKEAKASADIQKPDLIIADVSLAGGESGIETAAEIIGNSGIPAIICSGYEKEELIEKIEIFGNGYFLPKPIIISELVNLIERL